MSSRPQKFEGPNLGLIVGRGQGCREPNVGPGPAQIWRISRFVNSKTEWENGAVLSELWCDLQKKVFTEIQTVFPVEIRWIPKKKGLQASHADFSVSFRWAPLELMDHLLGLLKPTAFLKPMVPLKSMGPGVIIHPCSPSWRPWPRSEFSAPEAWIWTAVLQLRSQGISGGVLEDTIWSAWPCPRSLQVLENALSWDRGQPYLLTCWKWPKIMINFDSSWWTPESRRKKKLKTFGFLENAWIFPKIYEVLERRPFFGDRFRVVFFILEHSCPWPREDLSLALASDFLLV